MHTVYNLEMQVRDSMKRIKKTFHIGVYETLDAIEIAKTKALIHNPGVTFEVYSCEHILFEQQPS